MRLCNNMGSPCPSKSSDSVASPFDVSARTGYCSPAGQRRQPPNHHTTPDWWRLLLLYRLTIRVSARTADVFIFRNNYFSRYGRHNVGLLYMTGKRRKRDNWIWNCFQTRLLMLQIPVEGVGSCPVHVSFSWGPPRSRVISRFCWYREVRDLNFSDHVKHKKALKLYIILILKTSALRFFLWFFFWAEINKISRK